MKRATYSILLSIVVVCFSLRASACRPQVNLGGFISFCQGNSFTLNAGAGNPNATFLWSTNATTPSITVTGSGTYWVQATNICGTTFDTVVVQVDVPLNLNLGADRFVCSTGDTLRAPLIPGASYDWFGGGTKFNNKYYVTSSGTYGLNLTNACGTFRDSVVLNVQNPPNPALGNDLFLCNTNSVTLRATPNQGTYTWREVNQGNLSSGPNDDSIVVSSSGLYYVEVNNACPPVFDSIDVWYTEGPQLDLGGTVTICGGGSATILANANRGTYLWSTGATSQSISASTPGQYWVQFTDQCGVFSDTITVVSGGPAVVNLGPDTAVCTNKPLVLDAGNPGSTYLWSTNATSQTISVNTAGVYYVGVDNGCGFQYDTISISTKLPPAPIIDSIVYVCAGGSISIDAGTWGPFTTYSWSTGASSQIVSISTPGAYWVDVRNSCDTIRKDFIVEEVFPLNIDLGPDTVVCGTYEIDLMLPERPNEFVWSNKNRPTNATNKFTQDGKYWVRVTNACGVYSDTIVVDVNQKPIPPALTKRVCSTPGVTSLSVPFDSSITYLWSTGATSSSITVNDSGLYWIEQYNICDTILDTIKVEYVNPVVIDLGSDTSFCEPANILYQINDPQIDSVFWNTGTSARGIRINSSGTYWVEAFNDCGVYTDTVNVNVIRLPEEKLKDTAICAGGFINLNATQGNTTARYLWNTGDTTSSINVNQQGTYFVDIFNVCDTLRDFVFVREDTPIPSINLGNDTIFCDGTLVLDAGAYSGALYTWQDGSTQQTFTASQSGTYYVTARNRCNTVSDTIEILITGPPKLTLGNSVRFCFGSTLTLNAGNPGSTYNWSTGEVTQSIAVDSGGVYWVTITNDCGQLTDTVDVIVEYILDDVDLGKDSVLCQGQTLRLQTQYPDVQHRWIDGSNNNFLDVTKTGIYWVEVTNTCGTWNDSVYVEFIGVPEFSLGPDQVICAIDDSIELVGPPGMLSYLWNGGNGPATKNFLVKQAGTYFLTVQNECFSYTDTIVVNEDFPIDINLGPDTSLCQTFGYTIPSNVTQFPVKWNTGAVQPTLPVTKSGWYYASSKNACGVFTDSVYVDLHSVLNPPPFDTAVCQNDTAIIDLSTLSYPFEWDDESTQTVRKFFNEDTFGLTITNECGTFKKEFRIIKVNCECPFYIPNAFTPNGDGLNDFFEIKHECPISSFSMEIYNRWGIQVFTSNSLESMWDGTLNGEKLPLGVYSYKIRYQYKVYNRTETRFEQDKVTIVR